MASPIPEVRVLGELQVLRESSALDLPASKKTRALLGYLVTVGAAQPRRRLCELFWEGPLDPRAALRWSLSKLRPLLDDEEARRFCGDRERVGFVAAGASIDLLELRAHLAPGVGAAATAALQAAADLFRGDFLEGLDLPDCYRYHEWLLAEREAFRGARSAVLAELVARRSGGLAGALAYARSWVGIDPLDEAAQAAVVQLLGSLGQRREALAQYERCRRILHDELGTRPSAVLEQARLSLRPPAGAAAPATPSPGFAPAETAGDAGAFAPPLAPLPGAGEETPPVGRARELEQIACLLDAAAAGHAPAVLLLAGEPGIGKSRLLGALAAAAHARGGPVFYGRAFEAEMVRPYGAWIDALRSAPLGAVDAAQRRELAPLLGERGTAPERNGGRARLFDAVLQFLVGRGAPGAPAVLLLDDLQWLDDASAALLHYVARGAGESPLLCACAARAGELADSVAGRRLVRALGRERRLCRLELGPLSAEATAELVHGVAHGADPATVARVFAESRGHPLFALEVARALARGESALSASLGSLLRDRLWRLDGRAREILPWAAALGRAFDVETLESVCGLPTAELLAGLEELERHAILRVVGARFDFSHDLLRVAAYQQISEPRCRLVHRQIARALAAQPDPGGDLAADVSHHAALGGEHELAAAAAVKAGERCLRLFAPAEAAELAERGLHHLGALPAAVRLRLHVDLLKIFVHSSLGRGRSQGLERELVQLVEEAKAAGLHAQVQAGLYLLSVLSEERGDFAGAQRHSLQAAELSRDADPATVARALGNTGRCLAQLERDHPRAVALLHEADELARGCGVEFLDIPWGLGLTCQFAGAERQAIDYLENALAIARRHQDHWAECECMARLGQIDLEAGRPAAVLARTPELRGVAAKLGEGSEGPWAETLEALARLALGETDAAERLERALDSLRAIDTKGLLAYAQNLAAEADLRCGRLHQAHRRAEEALRAASAVDRQSQIALAHSCFARCALLADDAATAAVHLQALAAAASQSHRLSARAQRAIADLQS